MRLISSIFDCENLSQIMYNI